MTSAREGLAIGAAVALLPGIGLGVAAATRAGIGVVAGHVRGGLRDSDLHELGTVLIARLLQFHPSG